MTPSLPPVTASARVPTRPHEPDGQPSTARWRRPSTLDPAVALTVFGLALLGILAAERLPEVEVAPPAPLWLTATIAMTIPLAWRRRAPRTVLAVVTGAFAAFRLMEIPEATMSSVALFLVIYTVGAHVPPDRSRLPRGLAIAAMTALLAYNLAAGVAELPIAGFDLVVMQVFAVALNLIYFVAAWLLGDATWRRRASEAALSERAAELAASREALARRAVQDERVRIARELHDVVAHHVSVMGIQAGAARRAIGRDPTRAGEALSSVEQASRDAVTELQRLLSFLRNEDDVGAELPVPQPSLDELDDLIDSVRETGLDVDVEVAGEPRPLPDSVQLSAYRIVQEALTNTMKHARGATRATVRLAYGDDRLQVEVRDDGSAAGRVDPADPGGRGVVGMRERAVLHGGELSASSAPGGGFVVQGWLPVRATART